MNLKLRKGIKNVVSGFLGTILALSILAGCEAPVEDSSAKAEMTNMTSGVFTIITTHSEKLEEAVTGTEITTTMPSTEATKQITTQVPEASETTKTPEITVPPITETVVTTTTPPAITQVPETTTKVTTVTTLATTKITTAPPSTTQQKRVYVLNTNTHKIHYKSCSSVKQIKDKNYAETDNYEQAIANGYVPCKRCNP